MTVKLKKFETGEVFTFSDVSDVIVDDTYIVLIYRLISSFNTLLSKREFEIKEIF